MAATKRYVVIAIGVVLAAWIMAGLFGSAETSLGPLALLHLPLWAVIIGDIGVGAVLAMLVVELKPLLIAVLVAAILAAIFYPLLLLLPAAGARIYFSTLQNQALTQAVPTFFLSLFLGFVGALAGTILNASVRGYEL